MTACSCSKKENGASSLNTNDKAKSPEGNDSERQGYAVVDGEMAKALAAEKQ
jgi:hypothetical protein